jgi:BON domain
MMSSQAKSRIVVGVGLAAVFGMGILIFMFPAKHGMHDQAAQNAPAAQTATNSPAPNAAAPDQTAPGASASAPNATTAPITPPADASPVPSGGNPPVAANSGVTNQAALNGANSVNSGNDAYGNSASGNDAQVPKHKRGSRNVAQARSDHDKESSSSLRDDSSIRVASAADASKSSAPPNDSQSSLETAHSDSASGVISPSSPPANAAVPSSDVTPAPSAPAPNAEAKAASEAGADGADIDGRISAQVRSSIASLAPGSNIDVKTMSGIVALAGSVPSQDVVEQARQAAQQVAGVKQVDTSALTATNQ